MGALRVNCNRDISNFVATLGNQIKLEITWELSAHMKSHVLFHPPKINKDVIRHHQIFAFWVIFQVFFVVRRFFFKKSMNIYLACKVEKKKKRFTQNTVKPV